jgi:glutamine cyclotransferase
MNTSKKLILLIIILIIAIPTVYYFSFKKDYEDNDKVQEITNIKNTTISQSITNYTYKIINSYPHDLDSFTQGLVYENGFFYEGSGLYGKSSLRRVNYNTGEILQIHNLSSEYFGEGITIFDDQIIQLTWKSKIGFVYDKDSFEQSGTFTYTTEGWGVTHDGEHLIMSDGTSNIYYLDPVTFQEEKRIVVKDNNTHVTKLNELEYINGEIYANVWLTNNIVIIEPDTGNVSGWIDLEGLIDHNNQTQNIDVLNGIAYDEENERLFVTGKLWSKIFEIELIEK